VPGYRELTADGDRGCVIDAENRAALWRADPSSVVLNAAVPRHSA